MSRGDGQASAAVFDVGGVLLDWNPRYLYRKLLASEEEIDYFLGNVFTSGWNLEVDRGRPFEEVVALLSSQHPEWRREIEAYYSRWEEMLGGRIEGSVRLLRTLHKQRTPLYALTNFSAEKFSMARARYDFLELFDDTVVSAEAGMVKPEKEIYEVLIQRTGIAPSSAVFIDDLSANVRAAEELGFTGVVFQNPGDLERRLSGLGLV